MCFHVVMPYFQEQFCVRILEEYCFKKKKKSNRAFNIVQGLLCHKGGSGFCRNGEIKSTYLLQREATMGDI